MVTDRRGAERHKRRLYLRIPSVSGIKDYYVENISLLGLIVRSHKKIEVDRHVAVELSLLKYDLISCECRVAWVKPERAKADFFQIGLEFIDLTPEQKGVILEYINLA